MSYIDQHLEPGERIYYRIRHSRKWHDVAFIIAVDLVAALVVWFMLDQLQRVFVESYIRSTISVEGRDLMMINLLLGILPFVFLLGLAQDFVFKFLTQLALTDRRIFGRVSGLFWMREISFNLEDVEKVSTRLGCLLLVVKNEKLFLPGFYDRSGFIQAYYRHTTGDLVSPGLFEPISKPVSVGK